MAHSDNNTTFFVLDNRFIITVITNFILDYLGSNKNEEEKRILIFADIRPGILSIIVI